MPATPFSQHRIHPGSWHKHQPPEMRKEPLNEGYYADWLFTDPDTPLLSMAQNPFLVEFNILA
jgi:hypothetical protein